MNRPRLTLASRVKALEAGAWQRSDGRFVEVRSMHAAYLINAYLGALGKGEPVGITQPLGAEILRRDLAEAAYAEATRRMK